MGEYLPIVILLVLGVLFVGGSIGASAALGPRQRPTSAKNAPYECGIEDAQRSPERFPVKFYLVAMIFIIFDIEVVFLYPWAVKFNSLGTFGLIEMVLFSVSVIVAFTYLISNGALDWAPTKALRRMEAMVNEQRTTSSTIRRVIKPSPSLSGSTAASTESTDDKPVDAPHEAA
jgi:NADH-quinone oxidoreductase subunit A